MAEEQGFNSQFYTLARQRRRDELQREREDRQAETVAAGIAERMEQREALRGERQEGRDFSRAQTAQQQVMKSLEALGLKGAAAGVGMEPALAEQVTPALAETVARATSEGGRLAGEGPDAVKVFPEDLDPGSPEAKLTALQQLEQAHAATGGGTVADKVLARTAAKRQAQIDVARVKGGEKRETNKAKAGHKAVAAVEKAGVQKARDEKAKTNKIEITTEVERLRRQRQRLINKGKLAGAQAGKESPTERLMKKAIDLATKPMKNMPAAVVWGGKKGKEDWIKRHDNIAQAKKALKEVKLMLKGKGKKQGKPAEIPLAPIPKGEPTDDDLIGDVLKKTKERAAREL